MPAADEVACRTTGADDMPGADEVTVADLVRRAHERYATQPAVLTPQGSVSFAELAGTVRRLTRALAALGCRRGDRVVLALENSAELMALEHAVFVCGLVRVAVSARLHPAEIAFVAQDCGARVVVCEAAAAAILSGRRADLPELAALVTPTAGTGTDTTYAEMLRSGLDGRAWDAGADPDDIAALLYTSGTTGRPKGAMVTHRAWVGMLAEYCAQLPPMGPGDVVLHTAPMSHFGGSVGSACTLRGAAAVILRRFDPMETLRTIERHRATTVPLVPTMLKELTAAAAAGAYDLGSVRAIPYGGASIGPAAAARAHEVFGEVLYQFYGLSEALAPLSVLSARDHRHQPGRPLPGRLASAGRLCPCVDVKVVPGPVRPDGAGEIHVRGGPVMRGYWNAPEQTSAVLRDGWFSTGDVGFVDDEGYLRIVDRSRDVVISGGFNVYPGEVERVIESLDGVQEAVVVGVPHPRWGEAVAAVVVTEAGHRIEASDIVDVCRSSLAGFKKPVYVEFADRLPRTGTGKVSRRQVRDLYWPVRAPRQCDG
ncbi:class I adenylate-forming enzyme family protein [Wenjunlia tyrosinilytica]|uniref:Ligase n=1 Tax=Wenjunlia tyrosinilytica TaxID=1544741 RepID=A0A917ZUK0_9ACTN|nr:AMP-binding protein [Wenjunlia tyrosinilytica]GGO94411.1 ligase [Wenjunlia tyrosinilytica]